MLENIEIVREEYMKKVVLDGVTQYSHVAYSPSDFARALPCFSTGYAHYNAGSSYYVERDRFEDYLIIYTLSGEGMVRHCEKTHICAQGQVAFLDCTKPHCYKTQKDKQWNFYWIHLNGELVKTMFQYLFNDGFSILHFADTSPIEHYFENIFLLEQDYSRQFEIKMTQCITNLLFSIVLGNKESRSILGGYNYESIRQSAKYIMEHYNQPLHVQMLANQANLSRYHYMRIFKEIIGEPPYSYMLRYRIDKARTLLSFSDMTVEDIAYKVGFKDINTFICSFKKITKTTPAKYRKYAYQR